MRKPNSNQKKILADYIEHVSTVFIAVVATSWFSRFDQYNFLGMGVGLLLSIACLSLSLLILRRPR